MELLGDKTEAHMLVRFDKNGEHQDKWMPYDYTTTSAGNGQPLALRCAAKDVEPCSLSPRAARRAPHGGARAEPGHCRVTML